MTISQSQLKIREARFFLQAMRERDSTTRIDGREEYGFCLSAFLSAADSVIAQLRQLPDFKETLGTWREQMTLCEGAIEAFMSRKRNRVVHHGDEPTVQSVVMVPLQPKHRDRRSSLGMYGLYGTVSNVQVGEAHYSLRIGADDVPATEACQTYVRSLERLVSLFTS